MPSQHMTVPLSPACPALAPATPAPPSFDGDAPAVPTDAPPTEFAPALEPLPEDVPAEFPPPFAVVPAAPASPVAPPCAVVEEHWTSSRSTEFHTALKRFDALMCRMRSATSPRERRFDLGQDLTRAL